MYDGWARNKDVLNKLVLTMILQIILNGISMNYNIHVFTFYILVRNG